MIELEDMHKLARELGELLRLQTLPLAVKMIRMEDHIPDDAQRPVRDMGFHLSFCQALSLSRRKGLCIAETKLDMWCFEPVVGLGLEKPPQTFLRGYNRYPASASSLEAAATWAKNMPRLDYGIYRGVLLAPLGMANFLPDIFVLYAEPVKMTRIMSAKNWLDGKDISPSISGHAACVYYIVPPIKEKRWHMTVPCGGDSRRAACEDYNMIFSAPIEVLGDLVKGLRFMYNQGVGLPLDVSLAPEYHLPKSYLEIGQSLGMDWLK